MKSNHNSMSKKEFVIKHFFWAIITMAWFRNLLRCLGEHSLMESRLILCGLITVFSLLGILLEYKQRRNGFSVFLNLSIGFGCYTILAYFQIRRVLIITTLIIVAVLSIALVTYMMSRKIVHRERYKQIISRRIRNAVYVTQVLCGLGLAFIIAELELNTLLGSSVMNARVSAELSANTTEQIIADNMEILSLLRQENWRELTMQQRLEVLTVVGMIEKDYLGLTNELNVGVANLPEHLHGYYDDFSHEIILNLDYLLDENIGSYRVLSTFLHEAYHSFEYRCCDAYMDAEEEMKSLLLFRNTKAYLKEFNDYSHGSEGYDSYYLQQCEIDSRAYAESRVQDYCREINDYFGETVMPETSGESARYRNEYLVEYGADGYAYLFNPTGECIAGPYLHIEDDLNWEWDKACRYTGKNGLIGYLNPCGKEITPPKFIEAYEMDDGVALVSEKEGSVYYIDVEGNRVSKVYLDGFSFEHQGNYARVLMEDGKWGIIDRCDEVVFSGADSINGLPDVTVVGSAIVDGHAVLFQLGYSAENSFRIIEEYEQFIEISEVHSGEFAIVKNEFDMYGVVDGNGEIIINDNYNSVEVEMIDVEEDYGYLFKLQNIDGTYSIIKKLK